MPFWKSRRRKKEITKETPPESVILGRVSLPPVNSQPDNSTEETPLATPQTAAAAFLRELKGPDLPVDTVHLLGDMPQGISLEPPAAPLRRTLLEEAGKHPGSATRWILLGWSSKDARTAAIYFQRALTIEPDNPVANDGLAWAVAELAETGWLEPFTAIPAVPAHEPPLAPLHEGPLTQAPLDTAVALRNSHLS